MLPPTDDRTVQTIVERCRACRDACDRYLDRHGERDPAFSETLRCVALLSVVADRLQRDAECPDEVVDAAVELARELPDDPEGCAAACRSAADALSEWLDGPYERH